MLKTTLLIRQRYLLYYPECCRTLTLASTGLTKESFPETLGVYEHGGYSNSKMYYKNKDQDLVLHYNSNNDWAVSKTSSLGKSTSYLYSACNSACPSSCKKSWTTFNSTNLNEDWKNDETVTIKCAGDKGFSGKCFQTIWHVIYHTCH